MFVLKTSIAVLICFLAIIAYERIVSPFVKKRARKDDAESTPSSTFQSIDFKQHDACSLARESSSEKVGGTTLSEMQMHRNLYYKLHNLEKYPYILPECRKLLLSMLAETLAEALKKPEHTILALPDFNKAKLELFLDGQHDQATAGWEAYLARRSAGGSREMFSDIDEARWWLKQAAPVKYVDGAWLGHINKITTPFSLRHITKNAWQVMSEELGDGDLTKNHVHVYRKLMLKIQADLPEADSEDFIQSRHGMNEARVWKAAIAQLLISLFPYDFLPEILGFNMAYECLPLHLMKTVKELDELGLDSYYFVLHISIDNSDSGHAAMALSAAADYVEHVATVDGQEAAAKAWKRVQTGFILAEGLPTTPESPSQKRHAQLFPRSKEEAVVLDIFAAKCRVAQKIHCNSRLKIGRHTLVEWLDPTAFQDPAWQKAFMDDLGNRKPWVVRGNSEKSKLVRELSWEGRMFGSFTQIEVEAVKHWIDTLENCQSRADHQVYHDFVGFNDRYEGEQPHMGSDIYSSYPVFTNDSNSILKTADVPSHSLNNPLLDLVKNHNVPSLDLVNMLPLWFASCSLLECFVNVPVRVSDDCGSAIVRTLRAQYGYETEGSGVAGIDELRRTNDGKAIGLVEIGLSIWRSQGWAEPQSLHDIFSSSSVAISAYAKRMIGISMRPIQHRGFLIGMTWAFMELHELLIHVGEGWLSHMDMVALRDITMRERQNLTICVKDMESDEKCLASFWKGCTSGRIEMSLLLQHPSL